MRFKSFIIKADQVLGRTVAETGENQPQNVPLAESETAMMSLAYIACAAFIIIGGRYVGGDFLAKELHVVNNLRATSLAELLLTFNHSCHPLYHSLLWLWVEVFGGGLEAFLRLPGVAFMLISAYLVYASGRRILNSPGIGFLAMLLVVFSPAVITHFSQLFGYSLSIMLACLATSGVLLAAKGERLKGTILYSIGAILLPMTLSAGVWLNLTLVGFMLAHFLARRKVMLNLLLVISYAMIGLVGGLLNQFLAVNSKTPPDALNAIDGLGQWLVAVAAQLILFVLVAIIAGRQNDLPTEEPEPDRAEALRTHLWMLFLLSVGVSSLFLLITQNPPATALCFTVPLAFGAVGCIKPPVLKVNKYFLVILMAVLLNLLLWMRGADILTGQQVIAGSYQPNLVQQFPSGERMISRTTQVLRQMPNRPPNLRLFVDHRILPIFSWYWKMSGGKTDNLESLGPDNELALEAEHYMFLPKIAVGFSGEQVQATLQKQFNTPVMLQEIPSAGGLHVFHVITPNPQEFPPISQPTPNPISFAEATK